MRVSHVKSSHPAQTTYRVIGDSEVPWEFGDYLQEYQSVRNQAAAFDLSGLGLIRLRGDVIPFLQHVLARDVEYLAPDRSLTSLVLRDDGLPLAIVTLYVLDQEILVETSVGDGTALLEHFRVNATPDVEISDLRDDTCLFGVEGPYAWGVVGRVFDTGVTALPYEAVMEMSWNGHSIVFSRSGFTGEYGYKIFAPAEAATQLWEVLVREATPAGERALEAAMLEVRQPVLHREGGVDVLTAAFNWLVDSTKQEFVGRESVMSHSTDSVPTRTIGFSTSATATLEPQSAVKAAGIPIGQVLVTEFSPTLDAVVGLARIDKEFAAAGLTLSAGGPGDSDDVEMTTLPSPYVVPTSWRTPIL